MLAASASRKHTTSIEAIRRTVNRFLKLPKHHEGVFQVDHRPDDQKREHGRAGKLVQERCWPQTRPLPSTATVKTQVPSSPGSMRFLPRQFPSGCLSAPGSAPPLRSQRQKSGKRRRFAVRRLYDEALPGKDCALAANGFRFRPREDGNVRRNRTQAQLPF